MTKSIYAFTAVVLLTLLTTSPASGQCENCQPQNTVAQQQSQRMVAAPLLVEQRCGLFGLRRRYRIAYPLVGLAQPTAVAVTPPQVLVPVPWSYVIR